MSWYEIWLSLLGLELTRVNIQMILSRKTVIDVVCTLLINVVEFKLYAEYRMLL